MKRFSTYTAKCLAAMLSIFLTASCSMMHDDRDFCPDGLYVRFVYDFNIQRADMFKDHVGYVKLYVFDTAGEKVAERTVSNISDNAPLKDYGYSVHFTPAELPAGEYRLQAVAFQKDLGEALAAPGVKYRLNAPAKADELQISLDHDADPVPGTELHRVSHGNLPLDTLWHTLKVMSYSPKDGIDVPSIQETKAPYSVYPIEEQTVRVIADRATYATVSMIRDTKHLNVTLREIDDPANVFAQDYEVTITDCNAELAHDNSLAPSDSLLYTPYASWTTKFDEGGLTVEDEKTQTRAQELQRTAHYNLMFNRLMIDSEDSSKSARLRITDRKTSETIADINLPYVLAQGRTAYDWLNYTGQEYLDREYDYHLDFLLKGGKYHSCYIVIDVLSWSYRVQEESLGKN